MTGDSRLGARSRTSARRAIQSCLLAALLGSACRSPLQHDSWILPPSEPGPPPAFPPVAAAGAVGEIEPQVVSASEAASEESEPRREWLLGEPQASSLMSAPIQDTGFGEAGVLTLDELMLSLAATAPQLSIAEQSLAIASARQLAALGEFDLELSGFATSAPAGFFENETAGLSLEQPLGLSGASVYGGYRLGRGEFDPTFDGKRLTNVGGEFAAGVRVPLLRDSQIDSRRGAVWGADIEREIAEVDATQLRMQLSLEATLAYWRWVAAGRQLEVNQELVRLAEERQEGLARRVEEGALPEIEQLDNERLVLGRRAKAVAARRKLEKAAIALSLFLRDSGGQPVIPDASRLPARLPMGEPPVADLLDLDVDRALAQRPELRRLEREGEKVDLDRRLLRNDTLPRLDFMLEGSHDLDDDDPTPTKGGFELRAGLNLSIYVQNRRAGGKLREAEARSLQIAAALALKRDQVTAEVRDAYSELQATFERVQQNGRAAEVALDVSQKERRRFDLGGTTILVLNLRERAAAEAELALVDAMRAYWSAVARYRVIVGEDLSSSAGQP